MVIILVFTMNMVNAMDDRSYKIDQFHVKAILNEDGSMDIEEIITYDFSGSFNGVFRTLKTAGSDGIDKIEIMINQYGYYVNADESLSEKNNTYQKIKEADGIRLKIFSKSQDEKKQFVIKYRVQNVAVKYNDIAELYWKFIGSDTDVTIKDFKVGIELPMEQKWKT